MTHATSLCRRIGIAGCESCLLLFALLVDAQSGVTVYFISANVNELLQFAVLLARLQQTDMGDHIVLDRLHWICVTSSRRAIGGEMDYRIHL